MTSEGALGASFIPVFTGYLRNKAQRDTWAFAQRMFWDMAVVLALVAILGCVFSKQVIGIFTLMGVNHVHWDQAIYLNRIIFPCVLFMGLSALAASILHSFQQFALPAFTGVLFNLVVIVFSLSHFLPAHHEVGARGLSHSGRRAGRWHSGRFRGRSGFAASGAAPSGHEVPSRREFPGCRRAQNRKTDGADFLRHRRLSAQFFHRHDFCHLLADAHRQHHLSLRFGSRDGAGPRRLRHGAFHRDSARYVPSRRRRQASGNEADLRLRTPHRLVHHHSCRAGFDFAARADHSGFISARGIRRAFHGAHFSRLAVLFAGASGLRRHQADHADVLLDARHHHAHQSGPVRDGLARHA